MNVVHQIAQNKKKQEYRVDQKVSLIITAITLSTANQFSWFLTHIHYRKYATGESIVSTLNKVSVIALSCKIWIAIHLRNLTFVVIIVTFYQNFMKIKQNHTW